MMESPAECDPTVAPAAEPAALERAAAAEEGCGAHLASESEEVSPDAADVRVRSAAFMPQHGAETAAAEVAEEEGATAAMDPTAAAAEPLAFDSRGRAADDALADAVSSPRAEILREAAAEGQQWLQQEGTGTAAAEGDGQQLFDEQAGADATGIPGALLSQEEAAEAAAAAGGEDEGADDFDEEGSAAAGGGVDIAEAEEEKQLSEDAREQSGADSDAEREERRRQKRERREKKREKKRRRKEKKKKKKKQFAEDEAEESEGNEEAAEAADAAADDVERDLLGDAKGEDDEEASPRAAGDGLLSSRDREATAAAELQQRRGGTGAGAGGGRGGKAQRRAAEDRHVAFFERDETSRRGRSEDGDAGSERDDEGRKRTVTAFDRALERIRLRKKRRLPLSNEECSLYCNKLLQQMSDAMQADIKAMEEGRPATAKLEMLDFACAELVKPKWRHWFLAEGCCQCIAAWLAPLKDNSLSNFTLRNKLLHVLAKLPITSQDLQSNDLGRVLVLLWDHPEEGDANRILIRQLIQRWTRPMLGLGSSHREFLQERDRALEANDLELQQKLVAAANANQAATQNEDTDETKYRRARIPVNAGHNFLIQPKSYITANEQSSTRGAREGPSHFSSRLLGRIGGDRTARRATRASKLFLEGRNL